MRLEQRSVRHAREVPLSWEDASRRLELSAMDTVCEHCGALHWLDERVHFAGSLRAPQFGMCCYKGKVSPPELPEPSTAPQNLLGVR